MCWLLKKPIDMDLKSDNLIGCAFAKLFAATVE